MKNRENRRNVFLKARMRNAEGWRDVCIRNVSSRGLMIETLDPPPPRGTHVEVRRGDQTIIARVMWTKGQRCGAYAQDRIGVEALMEERDLSAANYAATAKADPSFERRRPRTRPPAGAIAHAADRARWWGRAGEFATFAAIGVVLAGAVFAVAGKTLSEPLAHVSSVFSR